MFAIGHAPKTIDIDCGDADPVSVAFTCDGKYIVSGERYSKRSGGRFLQFQLGGNLNETTAPMVDINDGFDSGIVSKDGKWIVSIMENMMAVTVRNTTTDKVVEIDEQALRVHAIDVSPDSTKFALGLEDTTVRIFCIRTGKRLLDPLQHDNVVFGLRFCPHGTRIATATFGGGVWIWNVDTGELLEVIHVGPGFVNPPTANLAHYFTPLGWSNDGRRIFVVSSRRIVALDLEYPGNTPRWYPESIPASNDPSFCSLATNGRFIACAAGGLLSFWDATFLYAQIGPTITFQNSILSISLSPDGSFLACGRGDKKITVYALRDILPLDLILDPTSRIPLMSVSDAAFKPWIQQTLGRAREMLSQDTRPGYGHHALANRALVEASLGGDLHMKNATHHANESLASRPSVIGHIAKARALLGQGQQELAFEAFDLAFRDCCAEETKFLLLVKAILVFISGKRENAIARINDLIPVADDSAKYDYLQVLANMYLMQGHTELTMQSFERAQSLSFCRRGYHLVTILLIFGRSFEELEITVRRPLRTATTA